MRWPVVAGVWAAALGTGASAAPPVAWVVPVLERIEPNTPPGARTAVVLEAGRREIASFQIAVQAPAKGLTGLRFDVTPLTGPGASAIGGDRITLYRENFVTLRRHSPVVRSLPRQPNLPLRIDTFPDALIPFIDPATGRRPGRATYAAAPIDLNSGADGAYWVDVRVPAGTKPGTYSGRYAVTSDQGRVSGAVTLTVLPFTVPLAPTLGSSMNSYTSRPPGEIDELLRNRLMPDDVPVADEARLIADDGLASTNLGFWSGADVSHCTMKPAPGVAAIEQARAAHDPRLFRYNFTADEITRCQELFPTVRAWARDLHAANTPNLITMAPVPALLDDGSGAGRSAVDIWVVLPEEYIRAQSFDPPRITEARQKGDAVWFYTALVQDGYSPKWEVDFPPLDYRISTGFLNASQRLTGVLYWSVDFWTKHPWTDVEYPGGCSGGVCWSFPGEGFLVYPGADAGLAGVAPSLRLKYIRDGVQDYERFAVLERCGHGEEARALARGVGRAYDHWTRDEETLIAASHRLATLIVKYGCSA